jgi:hypothetical protein
MNNSPHGYVIPDFSLNLVGEDVVHLRSVSAKLKIVLQIAYSRNTA